MMMMMMMVAWIGSDDYQYSGSVLDRLDLDENQLLDRMELEQFLSGFEMKDDLDSIALRLDVNNDSVVSFSELEMYWNKKIQVSTPLGLVNWIRHALQLDFLASVFPAESITGFAVPQLLTNEKQVVALGVPTDAVPHLWRSVAANVLGLGTGKRVAIISFFLPSSNSSILTNFADF